jgi:hypothetical protein
VEDKTIWKDRLQSTSIFSLGEKSIDNFDIGPMLGDKHFTSEQFVAALPQSRQAFIPKYREYSNTVEDTGY